MTALLRLAVRCPHCGLPPNVRVTPEAKEWVRQMEPDTILATIQCQGRCGRVYPVTAEAYQRAA